MKIKSIKSWAEDERPRERLLSKGAAALSNVELLAILVGSGNAEESAVDLCRRIYADAGNNLTNLSRYSVTELMKYKGIGEAKAVTICAAMELSRRRSLEVALEQKQINTSKLAFEALKPLLSDLRVECFYVLLLNTANRLIKIEKISEGGMAGTVVDQRLIFKSAIENNATAVILAHNHPSGQLKPSANDKALTSKFLKAGQILDIPVLDHLIIGNNSYFSFADEGILV